MEFYGYHGVFSEEKRLGQRYVVDLCAEINLKKAGNSDHLEDSINYAELYTICKEIVEGEPYNLVESVAEKIAMTILERYLRIAACTVKVIKPDPPIPGHYQSVAIEITRRRNS